MIEAGLKHGHASANDIRHRDFAQPNIIGATFKLLHGCGFVKTGDTVKAAGEKRHAGTIFRWRLVDSTKAQAFLRRARGNMLAIPAKTDDGQQLLAL